MTLPSNSKQAGDIGHVEDHNSIVDEIIYIKNNFYSASSLNFNFPDYLRKDTASITYLSVSASIQWNDILNKPDPMIGINLTGIITGSSSATLVDLTNNQITINTQQNININSQTVSSYILQLSDSGKLITMNNSSENAIVIPLESSVSFPIGSKIDITQIGSGTSSVTFVSGVTLNSDSNKKTINARWAAASLVKIASDSWILIGALK